MRLLISMTIACTVLANISSVWAAEVTTLASLPRQNNDAVTLDADGNIYVSNAGTGSGNLNGSVIYKVTSDGTTTELVSGLSAPLGSDFDSMGNLYISNYNTGAVTKVTPQGESSLFATLDSGGGIVINSEDEIFVSSYFGNVIYKVALDGVVQTWAQDNLFNGPVGLALDEEENLYVGNYNDGRILKIDSNVEVTEIARITEGQQAIVGYITYADGAVFATGFDANKIFKVSLNGVIERLAGTEGTSFSKPNGISANAEGTLLFVSEYGGSQLYQIDLTKQGTPDNPQPEIPSTDSGGGSGSLFFSLVGLLLIGANKRKFLAKQ